jgi:hypothetical protein
VGLIVITYVPVRGLTERVERALKAGGILVIETAHRDVAKARASNFEMFDTGELPRLFPGLRVVRYEEPIVAPDFAPNEKGRQVRYCGTKPPE